MAEKRVQRRLAAILFADVVGYSRLMREDEIGTLAQLKTLRKELLDPKIEEFGGRIVKTTGDGMLIEFPSAVDAVQHAVDVQQALTRRGSDVPENLRIELRIGINVGDIVVEGDDLFGDGVNVASRLEGLAEPGCTCVSGSVYEQVRHKIDLVYEDMGERLVKNIPDPIHVYQIALSASIESGASLPSADALLRRPAVAVLPFENIGGDPEQEYFADGLTEDIITALSLWKLFPVIARNSTFAYKGQSPDIRKVGEELGARYVIEGSIRKSGNRIRVTAQLINAENGHHVWADRYDREQSDIFELQDELTLAIAGVIHPEISRSEQQGARSHGTENLNAWECYHRGEWHRHQQRPEEFKKAQAYFHRATELDPEFAAAWCGISSSYLNAFVLRFDTIATEEARSAAQRALILSPEDPLTRCALGEVHYAAQDYESAIAEFRYSIERNPSYAWATHLLGRALLHLGKLDEGLLQLLNAIRLSPRDPANGRFYAAVAQAHLFSDRYEEAVEWSRRSIQHPDSNWPVRCFLVSALGHMGKMEDAHVAIEQLDEFHSGITIKFVTDNYPTNVPALLQKFADGLRKAGLPE